MNFGSLHPLCTKLCCTLTLLSVSAFFKYKLTGSKAFLTWFISDVFENTGEHSDNTGSLCFLSLLFLVLQVLSAILSPRKLVKSDGQLKSMAQPVPVNRPELSYYVSWNQDCLLKTRLIEPPSYHSYSKEVYRVANLKCAFHVYYSLPYGRIALLVLRC